MDLPAYHRALNLGFSESEASRIGDDAWENNRQQPTCDSEPEPDYCDVLVAENTRLRAELAECKRDAERYRWLRRARMNVDVLVREDEDSVWLDMHGWDLDAYVDAALAAKGE